MEHTYSPLTPRVERLREASVAARPSLSIERALIETAFYQDHLGRYSLPVLRAKNFYELCARKTLYIGPDELIVGERGPRPKAVPTFPELTCHSVDDLHVLRSRELQPYDISDDDIATYARTVIPYWAGRTQRERIFGHVAPEWRAAYEAGVFTEFMEQRAAGHTAMDGKMYHRGLADVKALIDEQIAALDYIHDPLATDRREELDAMRISCDAAILFARRHADLALQMAASEQDPQRREELRQIAEVCQWVPEHAPRTFREALQTYWFTHLGVITELNGWDCMNPGHLDQHLRPFYEREIAAGTLTRDEAKELIACLWIKFNNHPAPPKVGVTALESGTYNDFANINLGGIQRDGSDGVCELSYIMLEVQAQLHILQPGLSVHLSHLTPDRFVLAACRVIRLGYGYPSVFNADQYTMELVRMGVSLEDAREGGCSGCIEVGAFGKEAYLLTGYLNTPKILELTLHNGLDPLTGKQIGLQTGTLDALTTYDALYAAYVRQLEYFVRIKMRENNYIERMFALYAPATFLSLYIDDCIQKGRDYYNGGARYNSQYIQCCGLGTSADSLSALKTHVYDTQRYTLADVVAATDANFEGREPMRQYIVNRTPFFGNDDDKADQIAVRLYDDLVSLLDGHPNTRGGKTRLDMLSTTCHNYFGSVCQATPNGRMKGFAISDGTSPSHGADTHGPTALIKSLGKLDQTKSGGTLLNCRFIPALLKRDEDLEKLGRLIRTYFRLGGHHIQFNVVDTETLLDAQRHPEQYRGLLVRMAGYSDFFNDMTAQLQGDIIARTENDSF